MPIAKPANILAKLVVLDLTRARAGPTAARQLADWGANVIKIELPGDADGDDGMGNNRHGPDFQNLHRNKRGITLDMKSPKGQAAFMRLVAKADVVIENFRPDVKHRLNIDYEACRKANKRIIYGSISGFGQDGPYAKRPGVDQIAQGMGGLMSITGLQGQGPVRVGIPIADLTTGMFLANGILLAIMEREQSGEGQWVQCSLLASQIFMLDFQASRWLNADEVPPQAGNNHPTSIPTGVFKTKDGHINIAAGGKVMFERLMGALGALELVKHADYATNDARRKNRDKLNAEIDRLLTGRTSAECVHIINEAGVPCGPIYSIDQTFADPQVKTLGLVQEVPGVKPTRPLRVVGQPIKMSRTPSKATARPPERGEHNDEVLAELGFSAAEIADMKKGKVI